MHLSAILKRPLLSQTGEVVGQVEDVIVRLRGGDYPLVTGLVIKVGRRRVYLAVGRIAELDNDRITLSSAVVDLRSFERREGEVLLREDILGHRLINVSDAELVRARDLELERRDEGWVLSCLDTRRAGRFGFRRSGGGHPCQDWQLFEPLIGHSPTVNTRRAFGRVRRMKPAQIADLIEEATRTEGEEILDTVHVDPELEADVFEELDPDIANRVFGDRTDPEVAEVVAHMQADDAADTIAELPQGRRQKVLDLMPPGPRTKVMTLLGFNSSSAGGIMGVEFLAGPAEATVEEALRRLRLAQSVQPQALVTFHALDDAGRLIGVVTVIELLQAEAEARVADMMDRDPVMVSPETDAVDVALLMADYNLPTIPVVDPDTMMLGVITVDDVLEATIPEDWRRREPPARPESGTGNDETLEDHRSR